MTTDFTQLVTWVLVILGWLLVNTQNNNRVIRKEVRQKVDQIKKFLQDLETKSVSYHTNNSHDGSLAWDIKKSIQHLWFDAQRVNIVTEDELATTLAGLRKSITYKNFDTTAHKTLDFNDDIIVSISSSIEKLISVIEHSYAKKYLGIASVWSQFKIHF